MKKSSSKNIVLFDSHCHLDFDVFSSSRKYLWQQCLAAGIQNLLIPGVKPEQWPAALKMTEAYDGVLMSCGLHPWFIEDNIGALPADVEWSYSLAPAHCVAVGECGLDAAIAIPLSKQIPIFERHLAIAKQLDMPVIIHVRHTHNETVRLLKKYRLEKGGVIHGFTGSQQLAAEYWRMGFYLGIGGSITYSRANKTREAIRSMPVESLLLETDAPDMPLSGYQGENNSPLKLPLIAHALAELTGVSIEEVARVTTQNSRHLFGL